MSKMSDNSLYVYGDQNVEMPMHLNFGKYMFEHLRSCQSEDIALENALSGEKMTYKELIQHAVDVSAALTGLGVKSGHTVAVGSEKRLEYVSTNLGVIFTGATYVPYDLQDGRATLKHKLNLVNPEYFICSQLYWETNEDVLRTIDSIELFICFEDSKDFNLCLPTLIKKTDVEYFEPASVQGTDNLVILYSSGTTGMPKGVELTHQTYLILLCMIIDFDDESLNTVLVQGAWFHGYDTLATFKLLSLGRRLVYVDDYTPENILKSIEICQVNIATLVPSLVAALSKTEKVDQYDLKSLKIVYSRSAALQAPTIESFLKRFTTVRDVMQVYGMTETGMLTSEICGTKGPRIGSVGMAGPTVTLKIVNPETREILGPNEQGEILMRSPVLMKGYIGIDQSTYLDEEGFFSTGDLGYYDEDRYFYIIDRLKETIMYGGYNMSPSYLEAILLQHPDVLEAGVVGKPAGDMGEEPVAFVVCRPGCTVSKRELLDHVAIEVPPYMQLRGGVVFIPELPRNPTGKILRRHLREMLNDTE